MAIIINMSDFTLIEKFKDFNEIIRNISIENNEFDFKRSVLKQILDFLKKTLNLKNAYICEKHLSSIIIKNSDFEPYYKININKTDEYNLPFQLKQIKIPLINNHDCPLNSNNGTPTVCIPFDKNNDSSEGKEIWIQIQLFDDKLSKDIIILLGYISLIIEDLIIHYNSKINKMQQRLDNLNNEYNQFLHAVSHDIKAPVTAILGFISLIKDENLDGCSDSIIHYLKRISFNANLIDRILNDLLYIARLKITSPDIVDVKELIREILIPMTLDIKNKNIEIQISNNLPSVKAEKEHLYKLFKNILENSIEYSKKNGFIKIDYEKGFFSIEDNGIGIKNELLDKIFSIFFTTSGKKEGHLGTGLFIVKKIVELYRGEIKVESEQGKGTKIYFSLPEYVVESKH